MTRNELIRLIRRVKLKLMHGSIVGRLLVPLVEVCEFWVSHGFREVLVRSRMRLQKGTPPAPPFSGTLVRDAGEPLLPLTLHPPTARLAASIIIPVLNNAALTHRCLESIVKETAGGTYEVIVVDNGSDEPTRQMLSGVGGLRLIRNDTNVGFVGASNQGAAAAKAEFVVFLNNDTIVLPDWLDALIRTFERDPLVGAVGAKLVYPSGRLQEAGGIIWSDGHGWNYGRNEDPNAPAFGYVREVDYCSGACLAVRRSLFEQLGGFDNRYAPAYYEDVDLAFRLREAGYRVLYQPASQIVHFEGATAGTDTTSGLKAYQVVNHQKFLERHAAALATQYPHDPDFLSAARDRRRGKRVLVIDHMVPHYDQDAGSVRMQALLRIMVDLGFRVTFLPDNLAGLEPYTSELQQLGIEVLCGRMSELGFLETHGREFDVVVLCRAFFAAKYLPALLACKPRPFIIFDTVDLHYLREQRQAVLEDDAGLARAAERTRAVELGVMRSSDMVWVTSTYEAELLRADAPGTHVEIVPMIHSVRADVPPFARRRNILFIGSFHHPPNEDAAIYFVEQVLPLVRSQLPGVQLLVVGSHVPPNILALASDAVVVLGYVQDIEPVFDSCRVSVAPIRYGAGVKGKVTQSLAWGLPAVATPIAAEGTQLIHDVHLMIASDPAGFAQRVVEVYADEALWTRLSVAGRRQVEASLSYSAIRSSVGGMLERAPCDVIRPPS
jgi:GT2 family glycosyltransferase